MAVGDVDNGGGWVELVAGERTALRCALVVGLVGQGVFDGACVGLDRVLVVE